MAQLAALAVRCFHAFGEGYATVTSQRVLMPGNLYHRRFIKSQRQKMDEWLPDACVCRHGHELWHPCYRCGIVHPIRFIRHMEEPASYWWAELLLEDALTTRHGRR